MKWALAILVLLLSAEVIALSVIIARRKPPFYHVWYAADPTGERGITTDRWEFTGAPPPALVCHWDTGRSSHEIDDPQCDGEILPSPVARIMNGYYWDIVLPQGCTGGMVCDWEER